MDRSGRRIAQTALFWAVEGLAWKLDGRGVFFGGSGAGFSGFTIQELLRSSRTRMVFAGPGGFMVHDISRTGGVLVVRDEWVSGLMGRFPGAAAAVNVGVRDLSGVPALSSDGSLLTFLDAGVSGGPNYSVLMRRTDGSPETRLGEGIPLAISPDRQFVLAAVPSKPARLVLYPTGPGNPQQLDVGGFESIEGYTGSMAESGGKLIFTFCGARAGQSRQCYVGSVAGAHLEPIKGSTRFEFARLSVDGSRILTQVGDTVEVFAADGTRLPVRGFGPRDNALRWGPDGHNIWVETRDTLTMHVFTVNPETGARVALQQVSHPTTNGLVAVGGLALADNPDVYVYTFDAYHSMLYLVRGLR
jgi:hypothetical protein